VSVLLGRGDGTFNSHVDYTVGQYPLGLVAADFNGDGILDIAAVSTDDAGTLSLLLGKGDGTFTAGTSMGTFNEAQAVVAGDFNGDGKLDVAVQTFNCPVSCSEGTLALLLGNGNGTFQSPLGFSTANLGSYVVTGDFNNDGKLDFAVGVYYSSNTATVLLQTPDVSVSPGVINFGSQNTGTSSAAQNVTLTNNTANTITPISNTFVQSVTLLLLKRSARNPPLSENKIKGAANSTPTRNSSWSRCALSFSSARIR